MVGVSAMGELRSHERTTQPGGARGLPWAPRTGRKHVLSILVENRPGVLHRAVAGLFARRGFNIETLTVGPTDDEGVSRITLTVDGALHPIDQVTKQLHKLINVLKIRDLEPAGTVTRRSSPCSRSRWRARQRTELLEFVEVFRARTRRRRCCEALSRPSS